MFNLSQNPKIIEPDYEGPRTLLLIPSISFPDFVLRMYKGPQFFEERYLYFLYFLKQPNTDLVIVMSEGAQEVVYDYFMDHISTAIGMEKEQISKRIQRIEVPSIPDHSLSYSLLRYPEYIEKIKKAIVNPDYAYMECFRVNNEELELAEKLNIPVYGPERAAFYLNRKSGARTLFKEANIPTPKGFENLSSLEEIFEKQIILFKDEHIKKVVAKVNDAGSGLGFVFTRREEMPKDVASFTEFAKKQLGGAFDTVAEGIAVTGAIVEEFIQANDVISPSAQFEIKPDGSVVNLATHDQILNGVEYVGVDFPAHESYRKQIIEYGYIIAKAAAQKGAMGIFAIDFLLTRDTADVPYNICAIEINARKGGTNHTYMWAKYLTDATYNSAKGILECDKGDVYYRGSEVFMQHDWLKQVEPVALLSYIKKSGLDFNHETKSGVIIHLLSPLKHFGKFGCTVVGHSRKEVDVLCKQLEKTIFSLQSNYELHKTI